MATADAVGTDEGVSTNRSLPVAAMPSMVDTGAYEEEEGADTADRNDSIILDGYLILQSPMPRQITRIPVLCDQFLDANTPVP
jgi:hypothetical protein